MIAIEHFEAYNPSSSNVLLLLTTQRAEKQKGHFAEVSVLPLSRDQLSRRPIRFGFDYIGLQ